MLADSAVEIHAARLMVYDAAWKLDQGKRASLEAAMVKVYGVRDGRTASSTVFCRSTGHGLHEGFARRARVS